MAPLPTRDHRHPWLRYQVMGYTKEIVHDFEKRLETIFGRQLNRVHILDFEGLTPNMRQDLAERMRMVYTRDDGQVVFISHDWRRLFGIRAPLVQEFILEFFSTCKIRDEMGLDVAGLHTTKEMAEDGSGAYWLGSERVIPNKGDLSDYWVEISSVRDFLRDYCSDIQYAVSIKEDTAYLCLHFTKDHEGNKINAVSRKDQYVVSSYGNNIFWKISNVVPTPRNPRYAETDHDDEQEISEIFRIEINLFDYETSLCEEFKEFNYLLKIDPDLLTKDIEGFKTYEEFKDDWIYEWNNEVPWVHEKQWTNYGAWNEPTPVTHCCKPFNYKTGCSEWPTCGWREDGYCNGGNLPGTYIIGKSLHYQDYEWYKALEDKELKEESFRNKVITEGTIDDDDESSYERQKRWNMYDDTNHDHGYEMDHEVDERQEIYDEEYVAVKEDENDDLTSTSKDACRAYQEIFRMIDEG
ncbi:hypothetical protein Tco_1035445, partial [Tanacetum coccineum]